MTLALPAGLIPYPGGSTTNDLLQSGRVMSFRFDLLDTDDNPIGTLDTVSEGGSVTWSAYAAVKSGGSIPVTDGGADIDWLRVRIRPVATVAAVNNANVAPIEAACGVYIPSAPEEKWTANGRTWEIEMLDKLSVLDQDVIVDGSGNAVSYTAASGANVITLVTALIQAAGEATPAILPGSAVLAADQFWDAGTTRLKIINDLLTQAGYFSLFCDGYGQYRTVPYVEPANRSPVYLDMNPFSPGEHSLMSPDWDYKKDIYSVPNRYVAIGQGDGTTAALVGTAQNVNPNSPYSYPSRGRWITQVETGVEAVDQAALNSYAKRQLSNASSVGGEIAVKHLFLPDLTINSIVRFDNPDADIDTMFTVLSTTLPFSAGDLCSSSLREVLAL